MIIFKNRNTSGISLIEVTVVIFIIGMMLTSLLSLQSSSFFSFMNYVGRAQRIVLLTNELLEQKKNMLFKQEKTQRQQTRSIEDPPTKIVFKRSPVSEKSALKNICGLYIERAEASWSSMFGEQAETLIALSYIPEVEQKEGKA